VYEISPELLNGFAPNSRGRRLWSLARTSLKVKVKDQGHQGQKRHFSALLADCMQFVFGKTSLAFSWLLIECRYCECVWNDSQENSEVRAAAFALFGDLAVFGSHASKEQFLDQIHTNFVSFLLHLNDHENQVRQVPITLPLLLSVY